MTGISSRATKGKVTKTVARTMPGSAKTIFQSWAWSQGPRTPWRPNSRMKIMPAMTGDTAKGRSMSVISAFLPRKSNFAMAQDAARPNARFAGTATAAVSSVRRRAFMAIGSRIAAA